MPYENSFKISLIFSLLIHGFLLYKLPHFDTSSLDKSLQQIEVNYYKLQMLKLKTDEVKSDFTKKPISENFKLIKKEDLPSPANKFKNAPSFLKEFQSAPKKQTVIKPLHLQKKISLPEVKSEKRIKNPKYNSYYEAVRDKIRKCAYDNYNRYETGEVYLVFVVNNDGSLKDAKIVEEKTQAAGYLKEVALQSLKDASPYPVFPDGLAYPELSFNVIISFEISE